MLGSKTEINSRTYDPEASNCRFIHTTGLDDALLRFAPLDYPHLLCLVRLDVADMRRLYAFDDADEPLGNLEGDDGGTTMGWVAAVLLCHMLKDVFGEDGASRVVEGFVGGRSEEFGDGDEEDGGSNGEAGGL